MNSEQITKLQAENAELKRLLRLAVDAFNFIDENFGCAGCKTDWEKCPYNTGEKDECYANWKYADEAEKLLEVQENENT